MLLAHRSQAKTGKYSLCVCLYSRVWEGGVVINWASFQLRTLFLRVTAPSSRPLIVCLHPQSEGLDRERGPFLLAANSRQSAQPLVILIRIHGVGKQGHSGKGSNVKSLRKNAEKNLFFAETQLRSIQDIPRWNLTTDTWARSRPTQHYQSHANIVIESYKTVPKLSHDLETWLLNQQHDWGLCCVPPMWANVGFGACCDQATRNIGIKTMCQRVRIFKALGKRAYVPSAFLSHKKTKTRRKWREKETHESSDWGIFRKLIVLEELVDCLGTFMVH